MALVLGACGGGGSGETAQSGAKPLRIAVPYDVTSLDPIKGNGGTDHVVLFSFYDTLISFTNDSLEPAPGLAESWDVSNPLKVILNLRSDVKFHDGTDVDAEAVKFNLDRARGEGSNIASDVASIADVRVVDDLTVEIELSRPDVGLLMVLTDRAGMMVSPKAEAEGDLELEPVGAGPWSFSDWKRGNSISGEAFADYWDGGAVVAPKITYKILTDPKTRATSLTSGQQDIAMEVAASDSDSIEKGQNTELHASDRLYLSQIYLNVASDELKDPRVRRALSLGLDRQEIVDAAYFGRATASSSWMPQAHWAAPGADVDYQFNPDEARSLLEEAGVGDGFGFEIVVHQDPVIVRLAEIIQAAWEKIGVELKLVPREPVQGNVDYFDDKKRPALLAAWTGRPDPAQTYRALFLGDGYFNTGDKDTPGLEELLIKSDAASDQSERAAILDEAAKAIYEDTPMIPMAFVELLIGTSKNVQGFESNLLGKPKFTGVEVK